MKTPSYIKSLVKALPDKPQGRKVWSIDLQTVWIPFFTATNTQGDTAIPADALGLPLRLAYAKDGSVRFASNGKPVIKVASELSSAVKVARENFIANLQAFANDVYTNNADAYKATVKACIEAGKPILARDNQKLKEAQDNLLKQALDHANQAEAEANQQAQTEAETETDKDKELVNA